MITVRKLLVVGVCWLAAASVAAAVLPGDANGDRTVDLDDFVLLKQNFGIPAWATVDQGDFDGDGDVDLDDFVILKQNFGRSAPPDVTVEYQIAASADDAIASGGSLYDAHLSVYWPDGAGSYRGYLRWALDIPAGSTITEATVSLCAYVGNSTTTTARMQVLDYDSCPEFSSSPYDWPVTAALVDWTTAAWTAQVWYDSDDVATLVQQFIDRPGYARGNYLGLRATNPAGSNRKRACAFDYDDNSFGAKLVVTYTPSEDLVADAGPDQGVDDTDGNGVEMVSLDGSNSIDGNGTIVGYVWTEGVSQIATGVAPTVSLAAGGHTITLTITDNDAKTADDTVIVTVSEVNLTGSFYLDPVLGQDVNPGTDALPVKTWGYAQTLLVAGNTLYCTGSLGAVDMTAADPVGIAAEPIAYRRWPGRDAPHITSLVFDGTVKDAHLVFDGFTFDPGYVATAGLTDNNAVNLEGASHVTFDTCHFEGPKLLGAAGDYAPYMVMEGTPPPTLTAGNPGNASYITLVGSQFSYSNTAVRMVEHPGYPDRHVRHWRIEDNDFQEAAEDFITVGISGDSAIVGNTMRIQNRYRSAFLWPGTATGVWPADYSYAPVTQDTTGASAMLYYFRNGRIYLLADDQNHPPRRNTTDVWRLDSDPAGAQFTPSGTGDSTHGDCIAVQGATQNLLIARNWMETDPNGGQALKLDYVAGQPEFITVENNVFMSRTAAPTYLILIEGGSNTVFRNNTIYPGPDAPLARGIRLLQDAGGAWVNLQFYNNIISGAVVSSGIATSDYNCWLSTPHAAFNEGPNTITVSGLSGVGIVDEPNLDFHLTSGSPARDVGDPTQAPGVEATHPEGVDFDGLDRDAAPDMGAHEYTE